MSVLLLGIEQNEIRFDCSACRWIVLICRRILFEFVLETLKKTIQNADQSEEIEALQTVGNQTRLGTTAKTDKTTIK